MIFLKCILILFFHNMVCAHNMVADSSNTNVIRVIRDFLLMQKSPIKVSFKLCWSNDEKMLLSRYLNKASISFKNIEQIKELEHGLASGQMFLIDLRCVDYINVLFEANNSMLFNQPYRWLVIVDNTRIIPSALEILVDSQFYLLEKLSDSSYMLNSLYKISKFNTEFIANDIGRWTLDIGFNYFNELSAVRNRSDLMGLTLNISYVITNLNTLNHLWDYRDKHIDGVTKLNYIFCHHVTDYMNASRNFIMRSTWGYKNATTNIYDGIIGDLQSGLAEIGGTVAFFTIDRLSVIDYIAPTTPTRVKFIFRAPPLSYVTNVFTLPFDKMVWYANFLMIPIISIVLYAIVQWEWRDSEFRNVLEKKLNVLRPKYTDVLVMELGAICQQGSEAEPKSGAGRIATVFIFTTLMFMYTSYSANIVALLQSTSDSIKTLDDLLNSGIKLGVHDQPYSHYYFKTQTETTRRAIYTQKVAPKGQTPNFMDIDVGIRRMRDDFFAFHVECSAAYKIVADIFQESEKCGLMEIEYWQMVDPWITMKKNSSYKELAKIAFRKVHENGLQSREYRKLYTKKPACESRGSNFISVGLIDCYYAFMIFGVGVVLSAVILLMEVILRRKLSKIMSLKKCNN